MAMKRTLTSLVLAGAVALSACSYRASTDSQIDVSHDERPAVTATAGQERIYVGDSAIAVGDTATIPGLEWVVAVNSEPITLHYSYGLFKLESGDMCGVQTGGTIKVLGFSEHNRVLVEYSAPGSPEGSPCPTGVQYLLQAEVFLGLTAQYNEKIDAAADLKLNLRQIIDGESPIQEVYSNGTPVRVGDLAKVANWAWVDVMNLLPVVQIFIDGSKDMQFSDIGDFDICGVETGGTVRVLGFTGDSRVLVEYNAPGNPMGTPCPTGTHYLLGPEVFVGLTGQYNEKIDAATELKADLGQIVNGESPIQEVYSNGTPVRVGDLAKVSNGGSVDVMNLSPVVQMYSNGSIDLQFSDSGDFDTCGVEAGGLIRVLGFTEDKRVLVEYTAPGNPIGTPCPTGTQYLLTPEVFLQAEKVPSVFGERAFCFASEKVIVA